MFGSDRKNSRILDLSGLKDIYHWLAQFEIFSRSSFISLVDCVTSWTIEKRASSVKSLIVGDNIQLRLLIYIKKSKGPKIEPCGTPAETSAQDKDCPFDICCSRKFYRSIRYPKLLNF